jgi:hypothetical protein
MSGDDGIRLYIDNAVVLDKWVDQGETQYTVTKTLTAGNHTIRFEFYDHTVDAVAKMSYVLVGSPTPTPVVTPVPTPTPIVTPTPTPVITPSPTMTPAPSTVWKGEYWNTPTQGSAPTIPTTAPDLTRDDSAINFIWKWMSPDAKINADHFVSRWTKTQRFDTGTYVFTMTYDDGMRIFIDNQEVFNAWSDHAETTSTLEKALSAGDHTIRVEFYENSVWATAKFDFVKK